MTENNERIITIDYDEYITGIYPFLYDIGLDKEYIFEYSIEVNNYFEETFIPGVNEIMDQIFNLYNITLFMKSCVIHSDRRGLFFLVNDTFMEDYIYRFIGLRNKIKEYIKIYNEFIINTCPSMFKHYKSYIGKYLNIVYNEEENFICMYSNLNGYEFCCGIHVEEKFRYLKDILPKC